MIVLKSTYPFCASKIIKQNETKSNDIESSFLSALEKITNSIASKGGKNRYIPLNAVYTINTEA
ncbi:MAG: hypothetical protein A2540_01665 [Sulfurimonas sp. RIFOXYD2_FULL_37_8]|jgi:Skp family chaperone for outer membrane proteins|nr:MAG: hypothetical protein A2540_01665 [Sulfurimonas sp. RIFOXYD2_FULL_37_8]